MKIYDTLSGEKKEFVPVHEGRVGIYVCGPTTYDYAHIGHARPAILFDIFRRFLEYMGYDVILISNITDVDDKIINKANELGKDPIEMAHYYAREYLKDMDALRVRRANIIPKATRHIEEIINLIKTLVDKGYAYESGGDVYFSVKKFKDYGKLSHRKIEDMLAGARVEVNEKKRDPLDFALWKASKPGEPSWQSPWGSGRPGWHIECSAMSMNYLGPTLDIHGGGADLIFPHHENEIAQSEAATGKPFSKYWMHVGLVRFEKEKMSKSIGNVFLIKDFLKKYPAEVLRLMYLNSHYRKPYDFSEKNIEEALPLLEKIWSTYQILKNSAMQEEPSEEVIEEIDSVRKKIIAALEDDFNTREAMKEYLSFINFARELKGGDALAALNFLKEMDEIFDILPRGDNEGKESELIELLLNVRNEERKRKNYEIADYIRDELEKIGIKIEDTKEGTKWYKV
ncbi:cysteine--tRNA ligase [Candidatus Aciduliprofundum boonei]|uniref:Cysteine--tRNA ligase n=1 Tax=Aciduliprofundum boonei (strain DSM 19572 / T469) TaxID=439481 RepID=B5IAB9_ACIB4|nr:cysteine--tRNA ligase [Candidatus Aciduliprofundum boonei]ADD08240.1 cysteinyl-tRNA synthetase [Aciduliprofundum boonei T469]EDY37102.1 cysteinyl-tRNA synthetase [Aciduliprofundum boonei T469]